MNTVDYEKLLAAEVAKVALLEAENQRLRLELAKGNTHHLNEEIKKLEHANKVLSDKLASEIAKNTQFSSESAANKNDNTAYRKSIFRSVAVPKKVIENEKSSSRTYTAYLVEVETDERRYQLSKRYKQFVLLNTLLCRQFGEHGLPAFPGKKNGLYFSSEDHTEKRRVALQDYLQGLISGAGTSQSPFLLQFLREEVPETSSGKNHH
ncbi:Phox domain-containing protein [Heterostelium album PN500]|uniref:Phox domain-containing protein n=1 Tax=Heterostelium pallidum (strain ATCC 26659 / Pp 5 / PN500) TaxID=670386 RepID=D3AX19_HETP5|nr:Phox domain-containing protein [Heterostelium album PN500]EFA86842.1 Phox domain-containing protein [Heterostelium album PN500]|eukprot:XP_020438945.1 Phox domain-containing protein [Heterostelium album PN500]